MEQLLKGSLGVQNTHDSDMYYLVMFFKSLTEYSIRNIQFFQCSAFSNTEYCRASQVYAHLHNYISVQLHIVSFIAAIRVKVEIEKAKSGNKAENKNFCVSVSMYACTFVTLVTNVANFMELYDSEGLSSFTRMDW